jgi:hypothetical protein
MNIRALGGLFSIWLVGWGLWRLFAGSPYRWLVVAVAVVIAIILWARRTTVGEELEKKLDEADKAERQGRYADALPLLLELAKHGEDGRIVERIAMYYLEGKVGARDVNSAVPWLEKAAAAGRSDAQRELGLLYLTGEGVRTNLMRAAELLEWAANIGDPVAQYHFGKMLEEGRGIPAKPEKGRELVAKAAAAGYTGAAGVQTATLFPPLAGSFAAAPKAPAVQPQPVVAAATGVKKPELKIKYAGVKQRVSAADGEITIGREPGSVIHVGAPHVSRHHATIIWDDHGYPLLVNLSQSGTSVHPEGGEPMTLDGSTRLEGAGRIGLFADFAYAESNDSIVVFEAKWSPRG